MLLVFVLWLLLPVLDAVATCTFSNGIEQTQEWQACSSALLSLCQLDPPLAALQTREKCVRSGGPVACMLLLTDELAKSAQGMWKVCRTPSLSALLGPIDYF